MWRWIIYFFCKLFLNLWHTCLTIWLEGIISKSFLSLYFVLLSSLSPSTFIPFKSEKSSVNPPSLSDGHLTVILMTGGFSPFCMTGISSLPRALEYYVPAMVSAPSVVPLPSPIAFVLLLPFSRPALPYVPLPGLEATYNTSGSQMRWATSGAWRLRACRERESVFVCVWTESKCAWAPKRVHEYMAWVRHCSDLLNLMWDSDVFYDKWQLRMCNQHHLLEEWKSIGSSL